MRQEIFDYFNSAANAIADNFPVIIFGMMLGGVITQGFNTAKEWNRKRSADKAIKDADLVGHTAKVIEVLYLPTKVDNKNTGKLMRIQNVDLIFSSLDLEEMFNPKIMGTIYQYFDAALKKCSRERPVVFEHLKDVIPSDKYDTTMKIITEEWRNHFSETMRDPGDRLKGRSLAYNESPEQHIIIPVLTYDPDDEIKQFRVIMMHPEQFKEGYFPDPEDIFVRDENGEFIQDIERKRTKRLDMHKNIARTLNEHEWIKKQSQVFVPSGDRHAVYNLQAA